MTFKQFNVINEILKQGKTITLRKYTDDGYNTVVMFDENDDIDYVNDWLKRVPNGELFVFDGDFYSEVEL